jgi:hypothetical protein
MLSNIASPFLERRFVHLIGSSHLSPTVEKGQLTTVENGHGFGGSQIRIQVSALLLIISMFLDSLFDLSEPQFPNP